MEIHQRRDLCVKCPINDAYQLSERLVVIKEAQWYKIISCMNLGRLFNYFGIQISHLENGDENITKMMGS